MTIQQLANDLAARFPYMREDSPVNNGYQIEKMIEECFVYEMAKRARQAGTLVANDGVEGDGMPVIEKGIPAPMIMRDERNRPRTKWPKFLKRLEVGDSFVLPLRKSTTVMNIAKWMGMLLIRQDVILTADLVQCPRMVRVWRVA